MIVKTVTAAGTMLLLGDVSDVLVQSTASGVWDVVVTLIGGTTREIRGAEAVFVMNDDGHTVDRYVRGR